MWAYGEDCTPCVPPPELVVRYTLGRKQSTRRFAVVPGVNPEERVVVHNNSLQNMIRAATERVLFLRVDGELVNCPRPSPSEVTSCLGLFAQRLLTRLPSTTPVAMCDYASQYTGRKRLVNEAAVASLEMEGLRRRDAYVSWFVKYEKVIGTGKPDLIPRLISPRSARYNVVVGRYLKHTEKLLYRGIAKVWGERVVAKGLNSAETGELIAQKWQQYKDPVAVGLDAKRFDQHISYEILRYFEQPIFNGWFKSEEFRSAFAWQLDNVCNGYTAEGSVHARFQGRRMSGDMNTSSGNCLIMCALVWSYARAVGIKLSLINNGDDCVVFMNRAHLNTFSTQLAPWFLKLGFNIIAEAPVFEIEKIEFCQAHPIFVGPSYIMVRNLAASMAKDAYCLAKIDHANSVTAWCAAVGAAGTAMCGGVPVVDAFYSYYERSGTRNAKWEKAYGATGMTWLARGMTRRGLPILDETRLSYYVAFGVLPDMQRYLEQHFGRMTVPSGSPIHPNESFPVIQPSAFSLAIQQAEEDKASC